MIIIKKGDSKIFRIVIKDKIGNIVNLENSTFEYAFAKSSFSIPIFSKELLSGISIINSEKGIIEIQILSSDTDLTPGTYYHECKMEKDSQKCTIFSGKVVIDNSIIV